MKNFICIPTFNEELTIGALIEEILLLEEDINILVIDDNSQDNTVDIVKEIGNRHQKLHLLQRLNNKGRGLSGIAGFRYALREKADKVIFMDADFSHQPKYIPVILEKLQGYEVVIGSRYVAGGEDKRRIWRKSISRLAGFLIRIILGLRGIKDPTSGFQGFTRSALESVDLNGLNSKGPAIVEELLYQAKKAKLKILEIPILFDDRRKGRSKLNGKILAETFFKILSWRLVDIIK